MYDLKTKLAVEESQKLMSMLRERGLAEDEELVQGTIEGETSLYEIVEKEVIAMQEDEAAAEALKLLEKQYAERRRRFEERVNARRENIADVMRATEQRKIPLPVATLSLQASRPKLQIVDESQIPDEFFRVRREVNKVDIAKAITDGKRVPGASLSNGGESLVIRTK